MLYNSMWMWSAYFCRLVGLGVYDESSAYWEFIASIYACDVDVDGLENLDVIRWLFPCLPFLLQHFFFWLQISMSSDDFFPEYYCQQQQQLVILIWIESWDVIRWLLFPSNWHVFRWLPCDPDPVTAATCRYWWELDENDEKVSTSITVL